MAVSLSERQALMVLNALPHIGPVTLRRLLDTLGGGAASVLGMKPCLLEGVRGVGPSISASLAHWRELFDLAREEARLLTSGVQFLTSTDEGYPPLLREIPDPPLGLYRKGQYAFADACVAVIGSRRTSAYGLAMARGLGEGLARAGFCVVSGMARGIDTAAHEGALAAGGVTVAVLGNGIDIIYPPENGELYRRIAAAGAVLSEFPFTRNADRQSFAMRNRIVAGMCRATVVVESDADGGAMITARFAVEQGRSVCAVPGRVDQATSRGCHKLIREGAVLVTCVEEVLEELNYLGGKAPCTPIGRREETGEKSVLDAMEASVLACFSGGEILGVDSLVARLGANASVVGASLMMLELGGRLVRRADGCYEAL